jgi:hypothetical protein
MPFIISKSAVLAEQPYPSTQIFGLEPLSLGIDSMSRGFRLGLVKGWLPDSYFE